MKKYLLISVLLLFHIVAKSQLPENLPLSVYVSGWDNYCNTGSSNGFVFAVPSGGIPPYNFLWSTGSSSDTIFQTPSGSYSVTVSDAAGDTVYGNTSITDYLELSNWLCLLLKSFVNTNHCCKSSI